MSFAIATVIAHEYPGWLTQFASYGMATAISLARVGGQKHFPSDVFIGGTIGYLVGKSVYKNDHDPEVDYGTFERGKQTVPAERLGSTTRACPARSDPTRSRERRRTQPGPAHLRGAVRSHDVG